MALSRQELLTLARHGAAARISQLEAEIASIRKAFPGVGRRRPGRPPASADGSAQGRRRKRRRMSKEARKLISQRMKKMWAERKKGKK